MSAHAFTNAHLFCPSTKLDGLGSLLVEDGKIVGVNAPIPRGTPQTDCGGAHLIPGLVDMHVSTGEPGEEHRETLETVSHAAAAGGVTSLAVMANTMPPIDDAALVDFIIRRARDTACVRIHPLAAITRGLKGEVMSEFTLLAEAGAVAFSDAPHALASSHMMRRSMDYAAAFDFLLIQHALDDDLAGAGVMHEGEVAARLGLIGIPAEAESIMVARDLRLAELTGARYHIAQISSAQSVALVAEAKRNKLKVSCGVSVHHLLLNEHDVADWRSFAKLNPPLRSEDDRLALVGALKDGTIDVIVSAHDPQDVEAKRVPFAQANYGSVGVETLLAGALSLYHQNEVPLPRLLDALSARPASLLGLACGRLAKNSLADFSLVDLDAPFIVDSDKILAKSKNTALDGRSLQGKVLQCFVGGRKVFSA